MWSRSTCRGELEEGRCGQGQHAEVGRGGVVKVNMQRWGGEVWSRSACRARGGEGRCGQGQHEELEVGRGGVVKVSMQS